MATAGGRRLKAYYGSRRYLTKDELLAAGLPEPV